jgi:HEAT repeat protein
MMLACCSFSGCAGYWDEVTARNYHFKDMFAKAPEPLGVIQNSPDGDKRAKALRSLTEPLQHNGSQQEQDVVVQVLNWRAANDTQALCRLAAIQVLGKFKDPRAVEGLKEAYYRAGSFNPETANVVRCQALASLGETGNPAAVETLVKVLHEPPVEGPDQDKQQKMDERIAAARALGHFKNYESATALVQVLQAESDVALRNRAHESLELATGKHYPADAQVWGDYIQHGPDVPLVSEPSLKDKVIQLMSFGSK